MFFLVAYVKFAYCDFDIVTAKEARVLDVVVKKSPSRMLWGESWWGLVGREGSYSSSPSYSWRNIEREKVVIPS